MIAVLVLFFMAPPAPHIYTLSLHDALPISRLCFACEAPMACNSEHCWKCEAQWSPPAAPTELRSLRDRALQRSEEHTSELQSHSDLVCRLLLEKKKTPMPRTEKSMPSEKES